jgi:hypothetical protein
MIHRRPWNSFLSVTRYWGQAGAKIEPTASAESRGGHSGGGGRCPAGHDGGSDGGGDESDEPGGARRKKSAAIAGEGQLGASV